MLEPVIKAIGDWGRPELAQVDEHDAFQTHWLVLPLRFYVEDADPDGPPIRIQLDSDDEPLAIEASEGSVTARVGRSADPNLVLSGPAWTIGRLILGRLSLDEARELGVRSDGDISLLARLRVRAPEAAPVAPAAVGSAPAAEAFRSADLAFRNPA
jgi:hypothetical protein